MFFNGCKSHIDVIIEFSTIVLFVLKTAVERSRRTERRIRNGCSPRRLSILTKDRDRLRLEEQRLLPIPLLEYDRVRLRGVQLLVDAKTLAHRHCCAAVFPLLRAATIRQNALRRCDSSICRTARHSQMIIR